MRLNLEKCTFGVKAGKFLGFCLTNRGIEINPDKGDTVIKMDTLTMKDRIMKLNGMFIALNIFISRVAKDSFLFYRLLRKEV